ncbi:MAG: type IV secretory system conjugative DNA transfer family protein [Bacillaceae bacterium]
MLFKPRYGSRLPFRLALISFMGVFYLLIQASVHYIRLLFHVRVEEVTVVDYLLGNVSFTNPWYYIATLVYSTFTWLYLTNIQEFKKNRIKVFSLVISVLAVTMQLCWLFSKFVSNLLIKLQNQQVTMNQSSLELYNSVYPQAQQQFFYTFVNLLPLLLFFLIWLWIFNKSNPYLHDIYQFIKDYQFEFRVHPFKWIIPNKMRKRIQFAIQSFFFSQYSSYTPSIVLGPRTKDDYYVIMPGGDRQVSTLVIGGPGTGKSAALLKPIINQDLHHFTKFINDFPTISRGKEYEQEKGKYLNSIIVIEPSGDLCDAAMELALAHGIPKEVIYYVDPTNPKTPCINLFNASFDLVAEMFAMVIEGIGEKQEFYFAQLQRTHLKNYIYLLMLHNPAFRPTLDNLLDMYNDAQLVYNMYLDLKKRYDEKEKEIHIIDIEDRDERNYWLAIKDILAWIHASLGAVTEGQGFAKKTIRYDVDSDDGYFKYGKAYSYAGQLKYRDAKEEHVSGLRNILSGMATNVILRRVLFGKSEFDFDLFLELGGLLLVNTALDKLQGMSEVLGKFFTLSIQNATFRRQANTSTYSHLIIDEFPNYIYESFQTYPAQSRKYKMIITVVCQSLSQLAYKYGKDFQNTILSTMRSKLVYGDLTKEEADYFSETFGDKEHYVESVSAQDGTLFEGKNGRKENNSFTKQAEPIFSPSDLIYQQPFECAVKIVVDNKPIMAQQIQANFVPKEEFKEAVVKIKKDALTVWLKARQEQVQQKTKILLSSEQSIQQSNESVISTMVFENDKDIVDLLLDKGVTRSKSTGIEKVIEKKRNNPDEVILEKLLQKERDNNTDSNEIELIKESKANQKALFDIISQITDTQPSGNKKVIMEDHMEKESKIEISNELPNSTQKKAGLSIFIKK